MEIMTMGKVAVSARIENLQDVYEAEKGVRPADDVRAVDVADALVDTGATMLSIPRRLIAQLGLTRRRTRTADCRGRYLVWHLRGGSFDRPGRDCIVEAAEIPDECSVLIGQIPLEGLDFVVDPAGQRLIGNPDHGGEQMIDMF